MFTKHIDMYEALGVKDINTLLPPPTPMQPMDPASENIMALNIKSFKLSKTEPPSTHGHILSSWAL